MKMSNFLFIITFTVFCSGGWSQKYEYVMQPALLSFYLMAPDASVGYPSRLLLDTTWCSIKEQRLNIIKRDRCTLND